MLKIIIYFLLLTSAFVPTAKADEKTLDGAQTPGIMKPDWKFQQAVPEKRTHTGPEQSPEMGLPPANLRHMGRVGPEQAGFGISTHFVQTEDSPQTVKEIQAPPAPVTGNFSELRQMDTVTIDQIIDPLRIHLKDGRIVQLAGIDFPDLDPYDPGNFSLAAYALLEGLLKGKQARLYQTKNQKEGRLNRMGYALVHIGMTGDNPSWIQGTLIAAGLARIRPSARNPEMAEQMITLEDKARTEKKGIWADPRYAPLTPETATQGLNGWSLVEGRIKSVAMASNTVYLNFGSDWHTDFTIALDPDMRRQLTKNGVDPMQMGGLTVRVRGWLRDYNGPYIELLHPAWMQVLTENSPDIKTDAEKGVSR